MLQYQKLHQKCMQVFLFCFKRRTKNTAKLFLRDKLHCSQKVWDVWFLGWNFRMQLKCTSGELYQIFSKLLNAHTELFSLPVLITLHADLLGLNRKVIHQFKTKYCGSIAVLYWDSPFLITLFTFWHHVRDNNQKKGHVVKLLRIFFKISKCCELLFLKWRNDCCVLPLNIPHFHHIISL